MAPKTDRLRSLQGYLVKAFWRAESARRELETLRMELQGAAIDSPVLGSDPRPFKELAAEVERIENQLKDRITTAIVQRQAELEAGSKG
jgi:hypothetical protein